MLTKRDRFALWRGKEAEKESAIFDTVLFMEQYLADQESLFFIKTDLAHHQTAHFLQVSQKGKHAYGAVAFSRLVVEESFDFLEDKGSDIGRILHDLKQILGALYENPGKNTQKNAYDLIECVNQLLTRNTADSLSLAQSHSLFFSFYYVLKLFGVGVSSLGNWKKYVINTFIDLHKIVQATEMLLQRVDKKIAEIKKTHNLPPVQDNKANYHDTSLHDYFSERLLTLYHREESKDKGLLSLGNALHELGEGISSLIAVRKSQHELALHEQQIQSLLGALLDNEQRVVGRQYFLDLITGHQDALNLLIANTQAASRQHLLELMNQLKNPGIITNLSGKVLYGMSWATSIMSVGFRAITPQSTQESLINKMPETLDSQCKKYVKELAINYLNQVQHQSQQTQQQIEDLENGLTQGEEAIKCKIQEASDDDLGQIVREYNAVDEALSQYRRLSCSLAQNHHLLISFKKTHHLLADFIQHHDGWMVKLSNFLAQFFSFFKSKTALLIDRARDLQSKLAHFEEEYRADLKRSVREIEHNPDLPMPLKHHFIKQLEIIDPVESATSTCPVIDKEELELLIKHTAKMFQSVNSPRTLPASDDLEPERSEGVFYSLQANFGLT
ncbi:hypothetical protein [Legionella worsleiensis]|uniref:Purine NTPase n=1 Tax=Legionella worsleiensis TaxID=45076 RepID=A0A0W1AKV9_9GAMM|nr:hypothetical protein [Legionella worsleiensis]KTD81972.1 purine NTPase [Legionella worsleiensis]STY31354.1 purine NTPase, putative [Legionella worsleiensis]